MIDGERIKEETLKEKQYIKELVEMNFPMGFLEYMTQRPEEEDTLRRGCELKSNERVGNYVVSGYTP